MPVNCSHFRYNPVSYFRAISDVVTGASHGTPANPSYAYDGTSGFVDTSTGTVCTLTTVSNNTTIQTFSFASGTVSGTLHINMANVQTVYSISYDTVNETNSAVNVQYSINSGSTWNYMFGWIGGETATDYDCTATLTSQNMANLQVKITAQSYRIGVGTSQAISPVTYGVSDVVVL